MQNISLGDILIFSTFKQNQRFDRIVTICTFMQNLGIKVKKFLNIKCDNLLKSQNLVGLSNVDNLCCYANLQVKSFQNQVLYPSRSSGHGEYPNLGF